MSSENISVTVKKAEGHVLSERTAKALEALAEAVVADLEDDSEVSGFSMMRLGSELGPRISGPEPTEFCLGYYRQHESEGGDKSRLGETCYGIFF